MTSRAHRHTIQIPGNNPPPQVEIDTTCKSAYIKFRNLKIKRTENITSDKTIANIDFSYKGEVVGVELIGVENFNLEFLFKIAKIQVPAGLRRSAIVRACPVPA